MKKVRIALAEDQIMYTKMIYSFIDNHPNFEMAGSACNGQELLDKIEKLKLKIDVLLLDIEMPTMDGFETCLHIKKLYPETKVIALTTFDDDEKVMQMILNGASGYLLKDASKEDIYDAIEIVLEDGAAMSPSIALKVLNYVRKAEEQKASKADKLELLSNREREIIILVKQGLRNKEIAEQLFISEQTVRKHIENIYSKLAVNNRIEAIKAIE